MFSGSPVNVASASLRSDHSYRVKKSSTLKHGPLELAMVKRVRRIKRSKLIKQWFCGEFVISIQTNYNSSFCRINNDWMRVL